MRKILIVLFLALAFGLTVLDLPVWAQGRVIIDIDQPNAKKFPVAIPDFLTLDQASPSPADITRGLAKRLADNLDLTGFFIPLDPKTYIDSDPRAGLGQGASVNYREWLHIGADFLVKGGFVVSGQQLMLELRLFEVGAQNMILGKRYTGGISDGRKMINRFTNEILFLLSNEPGVFGTKIAFVQGIRSNKRVMLGEFGGDEVVQVSTGSGPSNMPAVSPSGSVAYVTRVGKNYTLSVGSQVIASGPLYLSPAFSPGGALYAAVSTSSDTNIYRFDGAGAQPVSVTEHWGINISPTFSPDGSQMAFVSDRAGGPQIYVSSASGGPAQRLTTSGNENTDPSWSPRGNRIAFCGKGSDIYTINPDGSGLQQLTANSGENTRPTWSPDGRLISFASTRTGSSRIFIMTANGERQRPMMPDYEGDQRSPFWSPVKPDYEGTR